MTDLVRGSGEARNAVCFTEYPNDVSARDYTAWLLHGVPTERSERVPDDEHASCVKYN